MTKQSTAIADAVTAIPNGPSQHYGVIPDPLLPADVRPLAHAVAAAAALHADADNDRRNAEQAAMTANADHTAAQTAAAMEGRDPDTVPDERAAKAAAADAARQRATATGDALRQRWHAYVMAICGNREAIAAPVREQAARDQADAEAALAALLAARGRVAQSLGLIEYVEGISDSGGMSGCNTEQGPRALSATLPVRWGDRHGKVREVAGDVLLDGISVWTRALETYNARRDYVTAIEGRRSGNRDAWRQPVPPGHVVTT